MAFAWDRYAKLAESLYQDADYEQHARYRAAASRFYYAAHWRVRMHLERSSNATFGSMSVHDAVVRTCRYSRDAALRVLGELLYRLKQKREHADYDASHEFRDVDIGTARRCYNDIDSALKGLAGAASAKPNPQ